MESKKAQNLAQDEPVLDEPVMDDTILKGTARNTAASDEIISAYYARVRHDSEALCAPLEIEDYGIQTMPEVSPPKWHLAHTNWFFETLLLIPFLKDYAQYHPQFAVLFNSYYDTIGTYHPRHRRGILSRPTVDEIYQYRTYIDDAMMRLLSEKQHPQYDEILSRTVLGLNHEQQHQELMLTDIKHIFATNPLRPVYKISPQHQQKAVSQIPEGKKTKQAELNWIDFKGGIKSIGFAGHGFAYDNETPQHKVYLEDFQLASQPVTNGQYLAFINDGGYQQCDLWLSDAWKMIREQEWQAPLYWLKNDRQWWQMTLSGLQMIDQDAPVSHVSYYEAAAYARWASTENNEMRLPTEEEWEVAASHCRVEGNFRESGALHPLAIDQTSTLPHNENRLQQMFGDVWEWTQTAYTAYPGYHAAKGPFGEYNGKFMSSQMVLRGGSCVTPLDHIRTSYRNFFYPHERWQFSGFRLARNIQ